MRPRGLEVLRMKKYLASALESLRLSGFSALAACVASLPLPSASASDVPLDLVFENLSGNSSSQIWIQFLGGEAVTGTYTNIFGDSQQLLANTAYSLDQLVDPTTGKSTVSISNFSGRVYVSYGAYGLQALGTNNGNYTPAAANSSDPNYTTRYQYMEPTIAQQSDGTSTVYADLSYIDFTAISLSLSARDSNTGAYNTTVSNYKQISANTQQLVNATVGTAASASDAILPAGASQTLPNDTFARVISPQFSSAGVYHDFTNYLTALDGKSVTLNGTFVGTGQQPSGNSLTQAQTYNFTGSFDASGNITLTAQSDSGYSNVTWLDSSSSQPNNGVGNNNITITITGADLNSQNGIYGNNVTYTVNNNGNSTVYTSLQNDVWGRIVGDLLAGLSLGYVGSDVMFDYKGTPTALGDLPSSVWWAAGEAQGSAPTYLADGTAVTWSDTPASQGIYFALAQPDHDDFYNGYAASLVGLYNNTTDPVILTTGYGFPLQDRLGNNLLSFNTGVTPDTELVLSVNPDGSSALPTGIWNGSAANGQWNDAANWVGGVVPASGASVQFVGASYSASYSVDTQTDQTVSGLYFNYASGSFTINDNTITLSGNIVNSSGAGNTQTINSDLQFATSGSIIAAFGDIVIGGDIALSSATTGTANTLTFSGTEATTVNGVISDGAVAGGSVVISGPGTVTLNAANTFTGSLFHQQGTLILGNDQALGQGAFIFGSLDNSVDTVLQATADRTIANALTLAGPVTISGSHSFTFTGPVTLDSTNIVTNTVSVEFSGAIGEQTADTGFIKTGTGEMTFSGSSANTFTGLLSVDQGTLNLNKSANVAAYGGDLAVGNGNGDPGSAVVNVMAANQTSASGNITINTDGQLNLSANTSAKGLTMTGGSVTGSGTLALTDGFQFTGTNDASATISSGLELSGTQTISVNATSAAVEVTVTGQLTGNNVTITKTGSGTISFSGGTDLTGVNYVTITSGMLQTGSMNASFSLNGGALAASLSGALTANNVVSISDLYSTNGAMLFGLGSGSFSDRISVSGIIDVGNGTTFLFRNGGISGSGTYTLISGVSAWQGSLDVNSLQFASIDIAGLTGSFSMQGDDLVFTATAGVSYTWTGGGDGSSWTGSANWSGPTPSTTPPPGADIIFAGTGANVSTGQDQTTGAITFASGATAFTIGGNTITLGGNLTNSSSSVQTVNSALALNASRTIDADGGAIVLGGDIALSSTGALPNTLTFTGGENITVSGVISDGPAAGGGIVVDMTSPTAVVTLSGNNDFSGTATLSGGITNINQATALGNQNALGSNILIFDGGTLQLAATMEFGQFRNLEMLSTGIIDTNSFDLTINGGISGSGGLTKMGDGDLTLAQVDSQIVNSYSGQTTVSNGTLTVGYAQALGDTTGSTVVENGASLIVDATGNFNVTGESLTLNGSGDGGNGALHLTVGISTWDGAISLASASSIQADANTSLTLGQSVSLGANNLTLNTASTSAFINIDGALAGSGDLIAGGSGVVTVTGANAGFTGDTMINGGILAIESGSSLGTGTGSLTVASGASLRFQGTSNSTVTFSSISLSGTGDASLANGGAIYNDSATTTTLAGNITLTGATTISSVLGQLNVTGDIDLGAFDLTVYNAASLVSLTGDISGSGGISTAGSSALLLGGANSDYSGATTVINGTSLTVTSSNALGSTSGGTSVAVGGALNFKSLTGISIGAESLSVGGSGVGSGAINNVLGNNSFAGAVSFTSATTIQATAGRLTLSGALSGSNTPLTIQGNGTVYFSGDTSGLTGSPPLVSINSGTFASGDMANVQVSLGTGGQGSFSMPTYSPGDINHVQTVNLLGLSFADALQSGGAVGLIMDLGAGGTSDRINVTNPSALNVAIQFYFNDAGFDTDGAYTLLNTSTGAFPIPDLGNLTFKSNITGLSGTFSGDNTSSVVFTASSGPAVWKNTAGNGQWSDSSNWLIGGSATSVTPAGGSATSFNVASAATVDTESDRYVGGIEFAAPSAQVTIANNTVTTYGDIVNNSSVTQQIQSNLAIDEDVSINAASGDLAITGDIALSADSTKRTLTISGDHDTTISGAISNGSASRSAVVKTGSGTTTWSGTNSFTGTTTISGGTLVLDGSTAAGNAISVESGGTLAGSGTAAGSVSVSGTLSPGNSPGTLNTGSQQWLPGGNYNWQLHDATAAAGTGYDTIFITGSLDLAGLSTSAFAINLWSLSAISPDASGDALNFNGASDYSWTLVSTTAGITGFNAADFAIYLTARNGTDGFTNAHTGTFSVSTSGNNLVLNYTAIPEPATCALLAASALALFLLHRRSRSQAA